MKQPERHTKSASQIKGAVRHQAYLRAPIIVDSLTQ